MNTLAPLLDPCPHTEFSFFGNTLGIPLSRKILCANKSLRNHHGDSRIVRASGCRLAGLLCILALAGCATGPQPQTDAGQVDGQVPDGGQPVQTRDVPPRALTLFERAVAAMAAGDAIDAELRFQEFLLLYPDYASAHVNLAIIFAGRGDDQAAARSLADALNVSPEYPQALNQLGMLLRRQGKFQEAEAAYLKAVTASPNYALAHYNLGVLNDLYLQRLDVALVHYEKYQELSDADKQVSRWIADLKRRISATQRSANVTE